MSIQRFPEHDLKFLGQAPVVYHCHHFNLFLDQTIDDALGEGGATLRRNAARQAAAELLASITGDPRATPVERLEVAKQTFAAMGHGRLNLSVNEHGGEATSTSLHYGLTWREKYGRQVRRLAPADEFGGGFSAAATAVAFGRSPDDLGVREVECMAQRHERCRFEIRDAVHPLPPLPPVDPTTSKAHLGMPVSGLREEEIATITDGLNTFLGGVKPDDRGLVEAFGVYVTLHLANYYNRISFDALEEVRRQRPELTETFEDLLRESGHVCVFNTFGGILSSPEWEGLVGPPPDDPETIVVWCLAIARALGFGRWSLETFDRGQQLAVKTPVNYEVPYFRIRHHAADGPPEYFFQGAVAAIMQLAHGVRWTEGPQFTQAFYQELFVDDELPWSIEQTHSAALHDPYSRVVVTKR